MEYTFTRGATVFTHDDEKVGAVDRVIVDLDDEQVTHVVVDAGLLFTERRLIPVGALESNRGEDLVLDADADPASFAHFEESDYWVPSAEDMQPMAWNFGAGGFAMVTAPTATMPDTQPTTPDDPAAKAAERHDPFGEIRTGDAVTASDGKSMGHVDRIVTDDDGTIEALEVKKGFWIFGSTRLIPATWIAEVTTGVVRLNVGSNQIAAEARVL
ncbi:MAG: PRC-barrel domain-containing protein [Acidimicrobiia bacterium]|nr:PRC-barrel domain-containing protein [Acidimicrobiia bacterium]